MAGSPRLPTLGPWPRTHRPGIAEVAGRVRRERLRSNREALGKRALGEFQGQASGRMPEWGDFLLIEGGADRDRVVAGGVQHAEPSDFTLFSFTAPNCDADSLGSSGRGSRSSQSVWSASWHKPPRRMVALSGLRAMPMAGISASIRSPQSATRPEFFGINGKLQRNDVVALFPCGEKGERPALMLGEDRKLHVLLDKPFSLDPH